MPLLKISMNKKANRPPSSAGNGNKFITARDRLIDEESVNKIKILSDIDIEECYKTHERVDANIDEELNNPYKEGPRTVIHPADPSGMSQVYQITYAVSYTHLTLPTNREV